MWDVEEKRLESGIKRDVLCASAGCSTRQYQRWCSAGACPPVKRKQLFRVMSNLTGNAQGIVGEDLLVPLWFALLALVSETLDLDIEEVKKQDPKKRATASPSWMAAAKARRLTVYLINTELGIPQSRIANVVGLSQASISQTCMAVEDMRDDPQVDELLDNLGKALAS